jgi:competence ComEA-like helix-hairpin-helix protein
MSAEPEPTRQSDTEPVASTSPQGPIGHAWPTREQEVAAGVLVFVGLLGILAWYGLHGGFGGRLVDIDWAEPLTANYQVDINTAPWPEFMPLPDVGETLARRIVQHREANGPFQTIDELRDVTGIGPKKLAKIRPYLMLGGQGEPHDDAP